MGPAMRPIARFGQLLFAVAILEFGVENFVCAHLGLGVRGVPWFPVNPWLGYAIGIAFLLAGLCIAANLGARFSEMLLGIFFLLLAVFRTIPGAVAQPLDLSIRTVVFETISLGSAALMLSGIVPAAPSFSAGWKNVADVLIKTSPCLFAISLIVFGITHFLVAQFIATLIPAWIPAPLFLAYFTGAALVAAGISVAVNWMARWATTLLGAMFLFWFLFLHLPRIMSPPRSHDPDEWSSAFIALGMCGGSWICARYLEKVQDRYAK
ncbi:MAG TPA: hypothetical protein VI386_05690 [Candidatus Sulfotelmatobacter sp.]